MVNDIHELRPSPRAAAPVEPAGFRSRPDRAPDNAVARLDRLSTNDDLKSDLPVADSHSDVDVDALEAVRAEQGLRSYVGRVAAGLGLDSAGMWCEVADEAAAYVALEQRLASRPARDVALVWDDRRGWAVGVETRSGEDLLVVAWYGPELLPSPEEVVRFVRSVLAEGVGHSVPPSVCAAARQQVRARLARRVADG
jgi:hypothetical protein